MDHDPTNEEPEPQRPEEPLEAIDPGASWPPDAANGEPAATQSTSTPTAPSWSTATSSPPEEPTIPSAAWGQLPPRADQPRRERPGMRSALIGGVVGALVGALAAGGIVAIADDDGPTRTIVESPATNANARPASVIQSPGDIQAILDKVKPAVVRINVSVDNEFGGSGQGVGTGFIVGSDGVIVTNAHVVEDADNVSVQLDNGRRVPGRVVGASAASDLAVVKIDGRNLPTIEWGDSDSLQVGDQVVAIGNALGLEGAPTVTSGIVSGLDRVLQEPPTASNPDGVAIPNTIQTDAAINPGNSGGPLVDANGHVVGINTAIANPSESNNVGFAIAITPARRVIDALRSGEEPQFAFLGVSTQAVTADVRDANNLSVDQGAYVRDVENGSAADRAGIREGDVIVEADGERVTSSEDVINAVRRNAPGDTISVTVDRDGEQQTFEVELRSRPDA